jgi:hypothetical protein
MSDGDHLDDPGPSISQRAEDDAIRWASLVEGEDFASAAKLAVDKICDTVREVASSAPEQREELYWVRVLFNGLRDVANLLACIHRDDWIRTPYAVERAWTLAHDSKERLSSLTLTQEFKTFCLSPVSGTIAAVNERYGAGLYTSWEVEIGALICTICGIDSRSCVHIPGEWYEGVLCRQRVDDIKPVAIAIVDEPRDMRCRAWPWNSDAKNARWHDMPIFLNFDLEGPDDGGQVLDLTSIFPSVRTTFRPRNTNMRYDVMAYRKLSRRELVDTVRECIAQHKLERSMYSRATFHTHIGSKYWDRRSASIGPADDS